MMRRSALIVLFQIAATGPAAAQAPATADAVPLRLRDAVAEALRASPALSGGHDAVETARIQATLAASRFGLKIQPNLNAGTAPAGLGQRTIGIDLSKRLSFGTEITTSVNSYSYGDGPGALRDAGYTIGVSQPLFRGAAAAAAADIKNARRSIVGAERAMAEATQQLIVTVAERFFSVLKQRRLVQTSERAVERAATMSAASKARADVGLATQLDVLRGDLLAAQATVTLASQREALAGALEELNLLLGRPPAQSIDVADEDVSDQGLIALGLQLPEPRTDDAVARLVGRAIAARADVREAHDRVGDAERMLTVSRWNLLPQVNLNASYTERGLGPSATPGLAPFMNGWRLGVATNYALDRSHQIAAAGNASVSLRAAQRAALDTERRVEADVRRAYRGWVRSRETIDIHRKTVELADRQVRLAQLRFERGLASSLDVVDAETNLYQAQTALIGAELERALAAVALERASGALDPGQFAAAGPLPAPGADRGAQ